MSIIEGDALAELRKMADSSVDLICTDPPYFKVKASWWDRQWDTSAGFLSWIGELCDEWQRVLKPNGSLYCFASPQMAWGVEGEVRRRFNVLNRITWLKELDRGKHAASCKEILRGYFPNTETIIFAEHFSADNMAKGEAGYGAKCDELRGFVFEPLRAYLASEWESAGLTAKDLNECTNSQMAGHYLTKVQWVLPTAEKYAQMQARANDHLRREYEDLRREYEDLRREYEDLRRPFNVTAQDAYTDVWSFPTVATYSGKHECEKPAELLNQIMRASGKPGATVLDCFAGSGSTLIAAAEAGMDSIGIEIDPEWASRARRNVARGFTYNHPAPVSQVESLQGQRELFAEATP